MPILPHIELNTGEEPQGTVILLHGLGADGWDFVPIVRELDVPEDLALRFIFPHAPERAVTINNGMEMPAWYDIAMNDIARLPDEAGIRESQAAVEAIIAREVDRGVAPRRIVLAGFSQGGAIALQTALRRNEALGGVVALSTYLALEESLAREGTRSSRGVPIFMAHGTQDPVVPLTLAEKSAATLRAQGYDIEWHTYPMPHTVSAEEIADLSAFLERVFTGAQARSSILLP
ncbi:MAG TPA: alpha/beta fold hydrolase [Usitatibacter sp.]|nr:alpha/beta fold hydrolase [Usitatibacter sp.]